MDRRPGEIFRADASFGWQHAGLGEPIQRGSKKLKGIEAGLTGHGGVGRGLWVAGNGERHAKQSRLALSEAQVGAADRAQARARMIGAMPAAPQSRELLLHRDRKR